MTNGNATMTEPTTHTLEVPGAVLTYDVRPSAGTTEPPLMLIGSPMGAGGFVTLASHFPDRTVVTYDPRGVERSTKTDPATESTPDQHGDDIDAVIRAVGGGPVDLFASSGGAINALALVARHPGDVRTLVAHEPPLAALVEDRETALAAAREVGTTYGARGFGAGMAKFILLVSHSGPIPDGFLASDVDPSTFGLPTADDGTRTDPLLFQNILTCTHYEPDIDALKAVPTRIVIGVGEESGQALAGRGGTAVAGRLGIEPTSFPGGHDGFLGGEYGGQGKPVEFAARLREVLARA